MYTGLFGSRQVLRDHRRLRDGIKGASRACAVVVSDGRKEDQVTVRDPWTYGILGRMSLEKAWVELPSEEEMRASPPKIRTYDFGFVTGMSRLLRAHPEIGEAFRALFVQIMFAPGRLDRREREMVAGVAAAAQDCHY